MDDRAGQWHKALNALSAFHITWQLYHIPSDFILFQGLPYCLALFTSWWRHDFSPDTHETPPIDVAFSENAFFSYLLNRSFMAFLVSFNGLFFLTNLIIFSIRNIATNVASTFTRTCQLFSIVVTSSKYVGNFGQRSNLTWRFEQYFLRFTDFSQSNQLVN